MIENVRGCSDTSEWIDDGAAPLALELDRLADVSIIDSCAGGREWPAYVLFRARGEGGLSTAARIAELLAPHDGQLDCELRAVWRPGASSADPVLELTCPAEQVIPVALALRAAKRREHRSARQGAAARHGAPRHGAARGTRRLTLV
jgi:hypothetical protein